VHRDLPSAAPPDSCGSQRGRAGPSYGLPGRPGLALATAAPSTSRQLATTAHHHANLLGPNTSRGRRRKRSWVPSVWFVPLDRALHKIDPLIGRIDDPVVAGKILSLVRPLESRLSRFAASTNRYGAEQVAVDQQELLRLHWIFSALA